MLELTVRQRALKRSMDIAIAAGLLTLLMPVLLLIAVMLCCSTRGRLLARERRIGRGGREMTVHRFPTAGRTSAASRHVGELLRRSSLHELPQLFDVLRGVMSLVAPPSRRLSEHAVPEGWHRLQLLVAPGMTGVSQVLDPGRVSLQDAADLERMYVLRWSLRVDLWILVATAWPAIRPRTP